MTSDHSAPDDFKAVMIGNLDLAGVMRGRSFPAARLEQVLQEGLPWVPANVLLSPLTGQQSIRTCG